MRVGLILPLGDEPGPGVAATFADIVALAGRVEEAGLDSVWVYDHLLSVEGDGPPEGTWEAWTVLAALAARTSTVSLGTLVSCTTFRHPGLLAKMAHSVAEISGDRLILGLGAGWHEPEYRAFGFPFDHRVDRFAESLAITATMLREGSATYDGQYYQVNEAPLLPVRDRPAPPILIGCGGGERMMGLVAQWADAWNGAWYGKPGSKFFDSRDKLHAACAAADRDPTTVDITVGMIIGAGERMVSTDATAIADALAAWEAEGVAHVIGMPTPTDTAGVDLLVEGVHLWRARN
jgi:alkanesulfonate monooxygenase SsuD/methylene tetrahydromethanopterin reductase-like flavin-dependent oxidoreductase (luciferase family)